MTGALLEPSFVEALGRLVAGARRTALGPAGGLHRSPFKGASVDFRQHRPYVPGDDPRRIDWRVLARTDRPYVREYDDETTRRTIVVVDASGSMGYGRPTKLSDAVRLAAGFAYVALAAGESAGLVVASDTVSDWVAPSSASTQLSRVVDTLAATEPSGPTTLLDTLGRVARHAGRRALVIVLSDLLSPPDALRRGLARLRHGRHDVVVVRVQHPDEIDFPFRGWVRFVGLEGEADSLAGAATTRNAYLARAARHAKAIGEACRQTRTDLIDHAVGRPLIDTVRAVVRRGRA